ncbi:MAG: AMP-binding protein [Candidatus Nanopelagicales bacterium]
MSNLVLSLQPGPNGVREAVSRLREVLDGGRSVTLLPDRVTTPPAGHMTAQGCVVLSTSGSTGEARGVELDLDAMLASARLAEAQLGGPGLWLTAIPVSGAGGLNTAVRSLLNGHEPVVWEGVAGAAHFDGRAIVPSLRTLRSRADAAGLRAYASLVPTQVARLLAFANVDDLDSIEALRELAHLDAVLIGADALGDQLRIALRAYGIHFITTYGATETCGGCLYDNRPFTDTKVEIEGEEPGRLVITGPTVASRYLDDDPDLLHRQWRSNDIGRWRLGHLELVGRLDDVVKVGGVALALPLIANALRTLAGTVDIAVLARDDSEWGHVPIAFVANCELSDSTLRQYAASATGRTSIPLDIVRVSELPLLANGKLDRQQLLAMVK